MICNKAIITFINDAKKRSHALVVRIIYDYGIKKGENIRLGIQLLLIGLRSVYIIDAPSIAVAVLNRNVLGHNITYSIAAHSKDRIQIHIVIAALILCDHRRIIKVRKNI